MIFFSVGPANRNFGSANQNFGPANRNFGPAIRNFDSASRSFGLANRNFGLAIPNFSPANRNFGPPIRSFGPAIRNSKPALPAAQWKQWLPARPSRKIGLGRDKFIAFVSYLPTSGSEECHAVLKQRSGPLGMPDSKLRRVGHRRESGCRCENNARVICSPEMCHFRT